MFKGSNVALITPFKNNELDVDTYIKLIHFHIENGTHGLVPAGTTGESPTLSHNEHQKIIEYWKGLITTMTKKISLIIPSKNEVESLEAVLLELKNNNLIGEIIVIVDNELDNSVPVAKKFNCKIVIQKKKWIWVGNY